MIGIGIGMLLGIALSRVAAIVARRDQPDGRALIALTYELWNVARGEGHAAVEAHASAWRTSSLFRRFPSLAADDVVRAFLVDAILLLADRDAAADLDHALDAALRTHRKSPAPAGRAAARRRALTLDAIRRGVRAMSRTSAPAAAAPVLGVRSDVRIETRLARVC